MTTNTHTHAAVLFLSHLDSSATATFNIEHYSDVPKGGHKPSPDLLQGRHANLTLQQVEAMLPALHAKNDLGAGIFVARNQCTGQRSELNITRIRGIHADMDTFTAEQLAGISEALNPSIVVESSPGRYQLYWQLTNDATLDKVEAKAINQYLAENHGADPAAVDVSRLLRLPGFKHMKYRDEGRTPTVTANYHGCSYTADEIRSAFPMRVAGNEAIHPSLSRAIVTTALDPVLESQITALADCIATQHAQLWEGDWANATTSTGGQGYPSQSEADLALAGHIARALQSAEVNIELLPGTIEAVFRMSALGQNEKWLNRPDYRTRTINTAINGSMPTTGHARRNGLTLESHGDIRNAKAFARLALGRFLYISTRDKWLHWHQQQWILCQKQEHFAKAKEVCGEILAAASAGFAQDQERGKRLIQEAVAAHNLPRIRAMIDLAASEPQMATTEGELDSVPYHLGVQNGVIDLRSGLYLYNQPDYRITRYCNASYVEGAACPLWTKFLDEIFMGDTLTIGCVQRLLGLTLLGMSDEEILVICYGYGSNGKSVFSNVIHTIMGGYSVTAPPSLLTVRRKEDSGPRNDLASLAGARYVSINEMQAGDQLDEQIVKMLAGREPISARFLHQEFFEFHPSFTPWLRTNHKPIITGQDDGIWRRLAVLPFHRKFTAAEKDPHLEEKLLSERDGILLWMINGAQLYLKDGIGLSPRMMSELATYRKDSDLLGEFLTDKTVADPSGRLEQISLYSTYKDWCNDNGVRSLSKKSFTQRLAERGHPEVKSGGVRYYGGLRWLVSPAAPSQGGGGGLGGIWSYSSISSYENLYRENTPNSLTSCPTCPDSPTDTEVGHA